MSTTTIHSVADRIVGCASIVAKTLGPGLPEVIYENALAHEMRKQGLSVCQKQAMPVYYDGMTVGDYTADLLVEDIVLVELTAVGTRNAFDIVQCTNYLKATGLRLSLLFNFGRRRLTVSRVVNPA